MKIKAYLKPTCGWSNGVRAILRKYDLAYEDVDIIGNRANYVEMVQKSGQSLSPCVEIDGVMLADISGEEVESYLLANNLVHANGKEADHPTNEGCSAHNHKHSNTHTESKSSAASQAGATSASAATAADTKTTRYF